MISLLPIMTFTAAVCFAYANYRFGGYCIQPEREMRLFDKIWAIVTWLIMVSCWIVTAIFYPFSSGLVNKWDGAKLQILFLVLGLCWAFFWGYGAIKQRNYYLSLRSKCTLTLRK